MRVIPPGGTYIERDFLGAVRLAVRDTRQTVWELTAPDGTCPRQAVCTVATLNVDFMCVIYKASSGALKVGLLVFLVLWLRTYPLGCGSG